MIEYIQKNAARDSKVEIYSKSEMMRCVYKSVTPAGRVKVVSCNGEIEGIDPPFFVIIRGSPVICFEATWDKSVSDPTALFLSVNESTICNEQTREYVRVANICRVQVDIEGENFDGGVLCKDIGLDGACLLLVPAIYVPEETPVAVRLFLSEKYPFWNDSDVLPGRVCWCAERNLPLDMDLPFRVGEGRGGYSLLGIKFGPIGTHRSRSLQKIIMDCQIKRIRQLKQL